jgi:hypothetical protein
VMDASTSLASRRVKKGVLKLKDRRAGLNSEGKERRGRKLGGDLLITEGSSE